MSTPTGPEVAAALASEGTRIIIGEDDTRQIVRLRYSLDSLRALEESTGSVKSLQEHLGKIMEGMDKGEGGVIDSLITFLAAGLRHVRVTHPDTGETVRLGHDSDLVGEMLDFTRLEEYVRALGAAFRQSTGPTQAVTKATAATSQRSTGRGKSGGTSPSTSPESAPPSSGT